MLTFRAWKPARYAALSDPRSTRTTKSLASRAAPTTRKISSGCARTAMRTSTVARAAVRSAGAWRTRLRLAPRSRQPSGVSGKIPRTANASGRLGPRHTPIPRSTDGRQRESNDGVKKIRKRSLSGIARSAKPVGGNGRRPDRDGCRLRSRFRSQLTNCDDSTTTRDCRCVRWPNGSASAMARSRTGWLPSTYPAAVKDARPGVRGRRRSELLRNAPATEPSRRVGYTRGHG